MNNEQFEGAWEQMKGKVKEKWGKLTNDDLMTVKGKKDQLLGKIRERYGYGMEQANRELASFLTESREYNGGASKGASKDQPATLEGHRHIDSMKPTKEPSAEDLTTQRDLKANGDAKAMPGERATSRV